MDVNSSLELQRVRTLLHNQFEIAWALTDYHLKGLSTEESLWQPSNPCIHVRDAGNGVWQADWPTSEGYEIGPPSIAWTLWHVSYWWTNAIGCLEGEIELSHDDVKWPGTAEAACLMIQDFSTRWRSLLQERDEKGFFEPLGKSWPIPDATLTDIAAWLNVELMKNGAEIGVVRFLYATRSARQK